jgi:hypothetical protein
VPREAPELHVDAQLSNGPVFRDHVLKVVFNGLGDQEQTEAAFPFVTVAGRRAFGQLKCLTSKASMNAVHEVTRDFWTFSQSACRASFLNFR